MKIIFLKDVPRVARKNEVKEVADGHALNFIIPKGLGMRATPADIKKLEANKTAIESERQMQEELLEKSLENLSAITVTITEKANEKGHLFEGVNKERLAKAIEKQSGIALEPDFIELEKPIKELGDFIVSISAHGKKGKVKVTVEGEK